MGNSLVTGEFPAQKVSNSENVSIWWRHHEYRDKGKEIGLQFDSIWSVFVIMSLHMLKAVTSISNLFTSLDSLMETIGEFELMMTQGLISHTLYEHIIKILQKHKLILCEK